MKQLATLIPWVTQRLIPRCKSNVKNYLTMLFLLSGLIFITQKSNAQCNSFNIDFKQGANRDGGFEPGQIHWIGSILQNSNSRYIEGMSTLQRIVMNNLPSCGLGYHSLRIKMESRKGDNHAYDFLTSWDNAFLAAAAIAPGFDIFPSGRGDNTNDLNECGDEIGACSGTACTLVTGGTGHFLDIPIIDGETNLVIEGPPADEQTLGQIIPKYETRYGNRTVRVYVGPAGFGGTAADNQVVFVGYGDANPNDGGDTYIYYDVKWVSTSPDVVIEYGAHIAVGVDGLAPGGGDLGVGYLLNRGASAISGGPYHCIIEDFQPIPNNDPKCEPNLGNLDNQLQGSQVLLIPSCHLDGPSAVCANATATYTATVTNPENATYLWSIINSSQAAPAATISGTASGNVPAPISPATTTPLSITVSTGGIGSYTVKLTITNGGQTTNTTDDDIISSCTVSTTVSGGPSITCPSNTTVGACQTQTAVNAAYAAWLATASGSTGNNSTGAPDKCGGTKTVTFTATNTCGTATCSASFTVTAASSVTLTCASNTTVPACSTQGAVDAAYAAWLATATSSGGCDRTQTNNSTGAPSRCGGTKTVVFTVTSSCEATKTCSASFTVTAATSVTLTCASNTTVPSCQSQATVDAAYAAWLTTATSSGGCDRTQTNNSTGAPSRCGGSKTVTFTVTSSCEAAKTCSASFTVTAPESVTLNCPSNTTLPAGLTQTQVDNAFAAWLASASATGGCDRTLSNNNNGAPPACGGAKTVTFTVTSSCEAAKTCSATFTVTSAATTSLTCPTSTSTGACQTQAAVDAAYATWLASVQSSGGTLTNNSTGAPDKCGGSKTVTFTVTAVCNDPKTCSATFTVTAPASVTLNCASNTTVASCQTQTAVDAAYAAWLATATSSGGCDRTQTNNSTGAPSRCGGSKTVIFTVTSSCEATKTCSASFTVTAPASVTLNCASNTTVAACSTQEAVDAAYAAWLATATSSGGCDRTQTNNSTGAPSRCGGSKTVIFTVTSSCEATKTCSASFTVTAPASVTLNCASNTTVAACSTQTAVDAAYAAWLATATSSGGCDRTQTNNSTGAPSRCGGSKTVIFTVTSSCEATKTCSASFTVTAPESVTLNCASNTTVASCQTQTAVDAAYAAWLATATSSGGCDRTQTNNSTGAPSRCGGSKTVIFTVTSSCEATKTCSASFTVTAPASVTLNCASNTTVASCQTQTAVDAAYAAWLATATSSGGCDRTQTNNSTGAPSRCGGSKTVIFTVTSSCEATKTCSASFTVTADITPPTITCSPDKETACDGVITFDAPSASDCSGIATVTVITDNQVVGSVHTTVWMATDGCGNTATCSQNITVIACGKGCTLGFWKTHTEAYWPAGWHKTDNFWTRIGLDPTVDHCGLSKDLTMQGALETNGGGCKAVVRQGAAALLSYATFGAAYSFGNPTDELHDALLACNCPQSLIDALNAANNNEFDADGNNICSALGRITVRASNSTQPVADVSADQLAVNAYPNPFTDKVRFVIRSKVAGQGSLEIYNMLGQKIETVYKGTIVAERSQTIEYKTSTKLNGGLIYIFRVGGKQVTGKLLKIEQ